MINMPDVKVGIVAVSRDCFPIDLSERRRAAVMAELKPYKADVVEIQTTVENEIDAMNALQELDDKGCNALVIYLGNFGPEIVETMMCERFGGPVMFLAAAEEDNEVLKSARGDAYCGLLSCSYNLNIRSLWPFIPERPVGLPHELAGIIVNEFIPIARTLIGLSSLKIITFGPRPYDFLACNAPVAPLFDLGVEIQENSELDLFESFQKHEGDKRLDAIVKDMANELGEEGNQMPGVLPRLAQLELTLIDWIDERRGACEYVAMANKCWPAFQTMFGTVPCYVNSRMTGRGIPVACEVDIYGALSEYIAYCLTGECPTLLDINNTVPNEMFEAEIKGKTKYTADDIFMGFHCGNTPISRLRNGKMDYQKIMHRSLEPDKEPDITRGTLEGVINEGDVTIFRLQTSARCELKSYIAQGEVLPVEPDSFGGYGVFGIEQMSRFYRHVLVEHNFPHHACIAFGHAGKNLYSLMRLLGVEDIFFNQPAGMLYKTENPFA